MKRLDSVLIGAAFICLSLLIVALGFRIHQLKTLVDEIRPQPRVGDWVPPYPSSTLDGSPITLGSPQGRFQVFYFFSPTCAICQQAEPQVAAIHQRILSSHEPIEMYGVSAVPADLLHDYAAEGRGTYPLIQLESRKMVSLMQVRSVPTMIVVDREGIVQWVNVGPIGLAAHKELSELLSAKFIRSEHGEQ